MTELTPEDVEAITKSVRAGGSWHAYKSQEKLRERALKAEARVAELEMQAEAAADQLRAAVLAERERCAKVCEADPDAVFSAIWKSLVIPGEFDAMDETDKNRWRGVIMQAIGFTAELKAAAIRGVKT